MQKSFYHIRFWHYWLILLGFKLIAKLPYRVALQLGKVIGLLLFYTSKKLKYVAKINIDLCFPKLSQKEKKQLLKKNCIASGIAIMETALAWYASNKKLHPLLHLHGMEQVEIARQNGHGILVLGAHFFNA